jgi:hypothetical protein
MLGYQAHLPVNAEAILRKSDDMKPERAVFENKVWRTIIIYKLANVAAFMLQGPEAFQVFKITVGAVTYGDADPGKLISCIVKMEIHDILPALFAVENFGPFQYPALPQVFGIGHLNNITFECPVRQVF